MTSRESGPNAPESMSLAICRRRMPVERLSGARERPSMASGCERIAIDRGREVIGREPTGTASFSAAMGFGQDAFVCLSAAIHRKKQAAERLSPSLPWGLDGFVSFSTSIDRESQASAAP